MTDTSVCAQLPLKLALEPAAGREAFFVSDSNRAAFGALERWRDWPRGALILLGPPGSGKTHLLSVWRAATGAYSCDAEALGERDIAAALASPALAIDNAGPGLDERALFHLLNAAGEAGAPALIAARESPSAWRTRLPDLDTRLRAIPTVALGLTPDDALLRAVIDKQIADRGLKADPALLDYVLIRMERSYAAARDLARAIDEATLAAGKPLSLKILRQALNNIARSAYDG